MTPLPTPAELRQLSLCIADTTLISPIGMHVDIARVVIALRQFAELIEQAEKGVTMDIAEIALDVMAERCGTIDHGSTGVMMAEPNEDDMRAALIAVAPHLALMSVERASPAKDGGEQLPIPTSLVVRLRDALQEMLTADDRRRDSACVSPRCWTNQRSVLAELAASKQLRAQVADRAEADR